MGWARILGSITGPGAPPMKSLRVVILASFVVEPPTRGVRFELVRQNINMPRSYPRYATVFRRHLRYRGGQCRRLSVADDCRNAHRPVGGVLLDGREPPLDSPFKPVPVLVAGRGGS